MQALEVDVGLIEGSSHGVGLAVQPWIADELVVVAAPGDALVQAAQTKPVGVAMLRQARWLLREEGSGTREMVEYALLPRLHQLPAAAVLGSSEAIARCVAQGLGISCLPGCWCNPCSTMAAWWCCPHRCPAWSGTFGSCNARASMCLQRCRPFGCLRRAGGAAGGCGGGLKKIRAACAVFASIRCVFRSEMLSNQALQALIFAAVYFTGMGALRGTGTAATLFWGEPSITRSE